MTTMREYLQRRKQEQATQPPPADAPTYRCGCPVVAATLAVDCPACSQKQKKPGFKRRPPRQGPFFRYPNGTTIRTAYDATAKLWTAVLTVPAADSCAPLVIKAQHTAIHCLLYKLAQLYRKATKTT